MSARGAWWNGLLQGWRAMRPSGRLILLLVPVLVVAVVLILVLLPRGQPVVEEGKPTPAPTPAAQLLSFPTAATTGSPALLLDDGRLFYEPGWGALEVRRFLEGRPGVLGGWRTWIEDREMPLADVLAGLGLHYGINPKVLLVLLEVQSGLVDDPNPPPEALDWAMGYRNDQARGLEAQLDWAMREIFRSMRDYPEANSLLLSGGQAVPLPAGANLGSYAVLRIVAQTGDQSLLDRLQGTGTDSFVQTYRRLFGEDPRLVREGLPGPASQPFLSQPYAGVFEVSAIFDHHGPFLSADGSLVSHMGQEAVGLDYDGHNGWDYALDAGVPVLAAAEGTVAWAGNSNDRCATAARGVILDHGNGYQTIYWHLSQVDVQVGQQVARGDTLGLAGASGCAEGPHLHFGAHFLGRQTDPEGWCGPGADPWSVHPAGTPDRWLWADRFSACQWSQGAILVDDVDAGFQQAGAQWFEGQGAVRGTAKWAASELRSGVVPAGGASSLDGVVEGGTWRPDLPQEGRYHVYAFVPNWRNGTDETRAARYLVHHAGGENLVVVDQWLYVDRWVDLGVYAFAAGRQGFVYLDNLTDETGFCIWYDAVLWVPE